jgi:hypothetical protein
MFLWEQTSMEAVFDFAKEAKDVYGQSLEPTIGRASVYILISLAIWNVYLQDPSHSGGIPPLDFL